MIQYGREVTTPVQSCRHSLLRNLERQNRVDALQLRAPSLLHNDARNTD
jgi:hypothetical protein